MQKLTKQAFGFMLAAVLALSGCKPETSQAEEFKEGVYYGRINPPVPTQVGPNRVEVDELFWYGCPHCADLEPTIDKFLQTKPANVDFQRVPATISSRWRYHAVLYYVGKMLDPTGEKQLHKKTFDAIQKQRRRIDNDDALRRFFTEQGYSLDKINGALNSMEMKAAMARADEIGQKSGADSVPMIIINGKYITSPSMAGDKLLPVVNYLIKRETK
ncbi:MAG: thiol:disulfide interchange protein DsbA/DsbL [Thiotrichaceae bacterium]|jgi:thiol:disulfide interchange protein DsbA|uniref:Thiol:disulfide interchange protein n=1 Tax=Candidatus Thiocaldithrix dubininis TaxID=3080823 RepID=A0AA95H4R9_9GAMM|nr:MAG: thiol:disulfide interchange protein DsbA/DsbL [Candidatus Thiocaldithrix dubininis]